jgi:cobalt-zinc-cadmium efflux system membrane fusion protein
MFATAEFATDEIRKVVQVPESAVQDVNGKQVVFLRNAAGAFNAREVTVGAKSGGRVQVVSGLQAGETVVVNGAYLLKTQMVKESGD